MIAQFRWEPGSHREFWPACVIISSKPSDVSPIACLLMDDGGLSFESTMEWIDEGIDRLAQVLASSSPSSDWDREDWGASFDAHETRAYSMYVEGCFEIVPTAAFQRLLTAWREFLSTDPKRGQVTEIDL